MINISNINTTPSASNPIVDLTTNDVAHILDGIDMEVVKRIANVTFKHYDRKGLVVYTRFEDL